MSSGKARNFTPALMRFATSALTAAILLLAAGVCVFPQQVKESNGNLFLKDRNGTFHQLTLDGRDYDPSLSADGSKIIFLRRTRDVADDTVPFPRALTTTCQIWMMEASGRQGPRLLLDRPVTIGGRTFYAFHAPKLSPKNDFVYFLVDFAATTSAIIRLAIPNDEIKFIATALQFYVVPRGQYEGYVVALQHRAKLAPGYYDWFWLLSPDGSEAGVVGMDEGDVDLFLEMYSSGISSKGAVDGTALRKQ